MFAVVAHSIGTAFARTIGAWEGAGIGQLKLLRRGDLSVNRRFARQAHSVRHERSVPAKARVDHCLAPTTNAFHRPVVYSPLLGWQIQEKVNGRYQTL